MRICSPAPGVRKEVFPPSRVKLRRHQKNPAWRPGFPMAGSWHLSFCGWGSLSDRNLYVLEVLILQSEDRRALWRPLGFQGSPCLQPREEGWSGLQWPGGSGGWPMPCSYLQRALLAGPQGTRSRLAESKSECQKRVLGGKGRGHTCYLCQVEGPVRSPPRQKKAKMGLCESPEGDARGLTRQEGLGFSPFDPPWTLTSEEPRHHLPGLGGVRWRR